MNLRSIRIIKARPAKEMLIRFDIEVYDNNRLVFEYSIVKDMNQYVTITDTTGPDDIAPRTNINVEIAELQQDLTNDVAGLQITGIVAAGCQGLVWDVDMGEAPTEELGEDNSVTEEPVNKSE